MKMNRIPFVLVKALFDSNRTDMDILLIVNDSIFKQRKSQSTGRNVHKQQRFVGSFDLMLADHVIERGILEENLLQHVDDFQFKSGSDSDLIDNIMLIFGFAQGGVAITR